MATRTDDVRREPRSAPGRSRGRFSARDLALVAAFAALMAVLALAPPINVPGNPVPIVLQNLGVMLAGALLGWKRGAAAVLLLIGVGFLGVPMLSGGANMYTVLGRPSLGFVIGYPVAAAVVGALVQAKLPRVPWWWVFLACVLGGIVVDYAFGLPVMAARMGIPLEKALALNATFLPGDLIKSAIAAVVVPAVHRAVPDLTAPLRRR